MRWAGTDNWVHHGAGGSATDKHVSWLPDVGAESELIPQLESDQSVGR